MKLGFIGFGEVAQTLSNGLIDHGLKVLTCTDGRSHKSAESAKSTGVYLCSTYSELAKSCDILLSAVIPAEAVNVAKNVGKNFNGIYVDLNNVSPATINEASTYIAEGYTVDAAIMGSIKNGLKTPIIASGPRAEIFAELKNYGMNIEVIGSQLGQASGLKMLRSAYTKGVSALLFESFYAAFQMGLDEILWRYLSQTEGSNFKDSSVSRLKSSTLHSHRRAQEMEEVSKFLSKYEDPLVTRATIEFFHHLHDKLGYISEKPTDYRDVFRKFKKNSF
jgi:3-hydroxyisobutyrate dehydrogenase-like beta-hydroxyacid dehydrogenase